MSQRKIGFVALFSASLCLGTAVLAQTAPVAPAVPAKPAVADEQTTAMFEKTCSACHEIQQVTSQQRDLPAWQETIAKMVGYGADVSPAQADQLAHYLADHYGLPPKK